MLCGSFAIKRLHRDNQSADAWLLTRSKAHRGQSNPTPTFARWLNLMACWMRNSQMKPLYETKHTRCRCANTLIVSMMNQRETREWHPIRRLQVASDLGAAVAAAHMTWRSFPNTMCHNHSPPSNSHVEYLHVRSVWQLTRKQKTKKRQIKKKGEKNGLEELP